MGIRIDDEFATLFPALSAEEVSALREKLREEGLTQPLIAWKEESLLLDGHHRWALAKELGLQPKFVLRSFSSRKDAVAWMIQHQRARRNLSDAAWIGVHAKFAAEYQKEGRAAKRDGAKKKEGKRKDGPESGPSYSDKPAKKRDESKRTTAKVAKAAGVGRETARKAMAVHASADKELSTRMDEGELSIDLAYAILHTRDRDKEVTSAERLVADVLKEAIDAAGGATFVEFPGMAFPEHALVYCGAKRILEWRDAILKAVESGKTKSVFAVCRAETNQGWFEELAAVASYVCFVRGWKRLRLVAKENRPKDSSAFAVVVIGNADPAVAKELNKAGQVFVPAQKEKGESDVIRD